MFSASTSRVQHPRPFSRLALRMWCSTYLTILAVFAAYPWRKVFLVLEMRALVSPVLESAIKH